MVTKSPRVFIFRPTFSFRPLICLLFVTHTNSAKIVPLTFAESTLKVRLLWRWVGVRGEKIKKAKKLNKLKNLKMEVNTYINDLLEEKSLEEDELLDILEYNTTPDHHNYSQLMTDCDCDSKICLKSVKTWRRKRPNRRNYKNFIKSHEKQVTKLEDQKHRLVYNNGVLRKKNAILRAELEFCKNVLKEKLSRKTYQRRNTFRNSICSEDSP